MSGRPLSFSPATMPLARNPSGKVTPGDLPSGSTRRTPSGSEKKRDSRGATTTGMLAAPPPAAHTFLLSPRVSASPNMQFMFCTA